MLPSSQPLDPKFYKKLGLNDDTEREKMLEDNIESQRIGKMFDGIFDDSRKHKLSLKTKLGFKWRRIKDMLYDIKYAVGNHRKWRRTINGLRPWLGFDGLISVMQTHLQDYLEAEEKYGISAEEYKKIKIASVKETLEILGRMKEPDEYFGKLREEIESRYPKYQRLISKYKNGGSTSSGDFVAQGNGWVGKESGKDPREGYFEFVNGKFELAVSPNQGETDWLLAQLTDYHKEISNAYKQSAIDSDKDFERLSELLKENMYSWWD